MTPEIATLLRAPFPPEKIGKLPRVTCGNCRESRSRVCDQHKKNRCGECNSWITTGHIHLDFVGHADTTDRLLEADPEWTWEPFALDARGLPAMDDGGGMWIWLTVAGVRRIGYGDADGKRGGAAVKETIGDAIRNASMRFGVALDLWRKETHVDDPPVSQPDEWEAARPPTTEQTTEFDALVAAVAAAQSRQEIADVGRRAHAARRAETITKAQYDRLDIKAGERLAELSRVEPVEPGSEKP